MAWRILLIPLTLALLVLLADYTPAPLGGVPASTAATTQLLRNEEVAPRLPEAELSVDEARELIARARDLRDIGERSTAVSLLQPLLQHREPSIAEEATYQTALLRLELGYPNEAAAALDGMPSRASQSPIANRSAFLLGVARRQAGDCGGSISALLEYQARTDLLSKQADLQLAACYQDVGDTAAAMERSEQAVRQDDSRRHRIEGLERQARILEKSGDRQGALARYERLVELARDRNYETEIRLTASRLSAELGREAEAIAHLVAVINEVPNARQAGAALDGLNALQGHDQVSFFQAGMVRFFEREYAGAIRNFDGALAASTERVDHPAAAYYRAVSRVRYGSEAEGVQELLSLPGQFPGSRYAPNALLRGGKVLESSGKFGEAADAYLRLTKDYPASDDAEEALFRLGLVNLLRGSRAWASTAWSELAASDAQPALRALGLLWHGKIESAAGDHAGARARWQQAVDVGPSWYGGLRARALLDGSRDVLPAPTTLDPARLQLSAEEIAELDEWAAARGAGLGSLEANEVTSRSLARLDELLALGLKVEASWEIDDLAVRHTGDPARLASLAVALHRRSLHAAALKQAQLALDAAGMAAQARQGPAALQKILYPFPYPEVFTGQAQRHGVDPLLFASLVRQESMFEPEARSSANALGLTQVIPSTGREIAAALGRTDFQIDDLFRPSVSLEFGSFYLGHRLRRFGGAVFPSLAAYNAGDGAVDRWLRDYGAQDMDIFAERIPYSETNYYIKIVFENYGIYRALYGAR